MKKRGEKRREILRPSPNEAANIIQSEKEKRKRIRLKQIREQEKAFSRKVLEDARRRKNTELKHLTNHLKIQWEKEHNEKQLALERKYHENLTEVGLGHKTASEDQTDYAKRELTEEEKQRASVRYRKAVEQLMYERAKSTQSERKRAEARQQALEIERQRAAKIASLPPQLDLLGDISLGKDLKTSKQKNVDSYQTSRFHLLPSVYVEWDLDPNQEDARQAAKDEEQRLQDVMKEVQRDKAEQTEKARLRHKHALAQLQLEEDHKKLMEELGQLERDDRQRRQDAVAKIPVCIFQPPHKRLEDAEDRQRDLEQAFEDMYMIQTGYMGDLTVALEPPEHLRLASDDSLQSESDKGSSEPERGKELSQRTPTAAGTTRSSEREEHGSEHEEEPEEVTIDRAPKAPSEDPLRRLLQRIERQRDQWRRRQPTEEEGQPPAAETTGIPCPLPSTVPPSIKQEYRVPDSIPFSASPESLAEAELSDEGAEDDSREVPGVADRPRLDNGHTPEHEVDVPFPAVSSPRTLLHPLEAAQRSHTTTPSGSAPTAQLTQQEALLEQEKLKLKLQQQTLRQQQLEQKLQDYQRQLADIYGPVKRIGAFERGSLEERSSGEALYEGASSLAETTLEPCQEPGSVGAQSDTVQPDGVPSPLSQEGSSFTSEGLESSTLGSVSSDSTETELPSVFRRTLAAAQATVDKAAELRQREKHVLEELSRVAEALPFDSHTQIGRDSASGSTSSLQSQDLVNISTPSTLSLSVTMPSELSVTAVASHTSQMQTVPNFFDHRPLLTTQSQPSSIVSDIVGVTATTSLLTKPSQQVQLSRPLSSVPQPFPEVSTGSEQVTVPGTGTIAEPFGKDYSAPYSYSGSALAGALGVSTIQQSSLDYSSVSNSYVTVTPPLRSTYAFTPSSRTVGIPKPSFLQQSSPSYSPGYLDYYQQKMEEEHQLFEEQRNRIHRYSDLFKKSPQEGLGAQTYLPSGSILSKTVSPVAPHLKINPYLPDVHGSVPTHLASNVGAVGLDANKENQGSIANSAGIRGDDRLRDISKRLGTFEKSLVTSVSSTTVTSSSVGSKPLSTSEWSYGSSKTDYMLLPQEMAGLGSLGSAGSTLSELSELTEMMTRLTSTSDESEGKSLKDGTTGSQQLASYVPEKTTKTVLTSSVGQSLFTVPQGDVISNGPAREPVYAPSSVRPIDVTRSYTPMSTGTSLSSTVKEPTLKIPSTRWTRGSDGKQWFVLSRSSTLSSAGGLLGKESVALPEDGEDAVFADIRGDRSRVPGSGDSGSSSEVHGLAPSLLSSATDESHGGSSQTSDLHADFSDESNSGKLEEVLENKPL